MSLPVDCPNADQLEGGKLLFENQNLDDGDVWAEHHLWNFKNQLSYRAYR